MTLMVAAVCLMASSRGVKDAMTALRAAMPHLNAHNAAIQKELKMDGDLDTSSANSTASSGSSAQQDNGDLPGPGPFQASAQGQDNGAQDSDGQDSGFQGSPSTS